MSVMMPEGGGFGEGEQGPVDCPTCGSEAEYEDIKTCEWCERIGCPACLKVEIDGWVCREGDCAEKLKDYEDRRNEV